MSWYFKDHIADVALVVRGNSLKRLLQETVRGLREIQGEVSSSISVNRLYSEPIEGEIIYTDSEDLVWEMCDLMNRLLSLAHGYCAMLYDLNPLQLLERRNLIEYEGRLQMVSWNEVKEIKTEIKAVTYSEACLRKRGFFWEWQICVDV